MATTIRNPEDQQRAYRLEDIAKTLRSRMRKEGIPAVRWSMSKMVRGWGKVSQAGVSIRVGYEWERDGYNNQQARTAHRRGVDYRWVYPSVIQIDSAYKHGYNDEAQARRRAEVEQMVDRVIQIAREIEPTLTVGSDGNLTLPKEVA
jgi:hypothetical protein